MREGRKVEIFMRSSGFHLPKDPSKPVIMVGPGTGLAPFRGFIQDRQAWRQKNGAAGPMVLFFGCRSTKYVTSHCQQYDAACLLELINTETTLLLITTYWKDYIYQKDLETAEADGTLSNLFLAFSRDQPEKVYVQHKVEEQHQLIWKLLGEECGSFYICGDAKEMARDVEKALVKSFQNGGGLTEEQAESKIKEMRKAGLYQADVWS